jgi:high-affinity K+ transport system ATPase subunit B
MSTDLKELLDALKQNQPTSPPAKPNTFIIAIACAVGTYLVTGNLKKTDTSDRSITELVVQIANLESLFDNFSDDLKSMREAQARSRIDPFTGLMATALGERLERDFEKEIEKLQQRDKELEAEIRAIEHTQ